MGSYCKKKLIKKKELQRRLPWTLWLTSQLVRTRARLRVRMKETCNTFWSGLFIKENIYKCACIILYEREKKHLARKSFFSSICSLYIFLRWQTLEKFFFLSFFSFLERETFFVVQYLCMRRKFKRLYMINFRNKLIFSTFFPFLIFSFVRTWVCCLNFDFFYIIYRAM